LLVAYASGAPPRLRSFPTRRSSDLPFTAFQRLKPAAGDKALLRVWAVFLSVAAARLAQSIQLPSAVVVCRTVAKRCFNCSRQSRSEEHTSELQSREKLVCRPPLEKA